jgi:hypothetical protein
VAEGHSVVGRIERFVAEGDVASQGFLAQLVHEDGTRVDDFYFSGHAVARRTVHDRGSSYGISQYTTVDFLRVGDARRPSPDDPIVGNIGGLVCHEYHGVWPVGRFGRPFSEALPGLADEITGLIPVAYDDPQVAVLRGTALPSVIEPPYC